MRAEPPHRGGSTSSRSSLTGLEVCAHALAVAARARACACSPGPACTCTLLPRVPCEALRVSLLMHALCSRIACLLPELQSRLANEGHFRVRHFGRVYAFPVHKHTSYSCRVDLVQFVPVCAVFVDSNGPRFVKETGDFECSKPEKNSGLAGAAPRGRRGQAPNPDFLAWHIEVLHLLGS